MAGTGTVDTVRRPSILGVGVVVWLASELMFFAGLFGTYFTLRGENDWPPEGAELAVGRTAAATVVLVASSFTMHRAVQSSERDDRRGLARWLLVTMLLAAIFLANQAVEYAELPFGITTDSYGSMFYLLTGFHGLHVLGGVAFMAGVIGLVGGRDSLAPPGPPVAVCGYYWHFVDVVWVAMFATLYLIR